MARRKTEDLRGPRERAYDAEIFPRMAEIIAVCKRVGIPVVATFELDPMPDVEDVWLWCTTAIASPADSEHIRGLASRATRGAPASFVAMTITSAPDAAPRGA